ncbi:MAG: DNA recombination protein RmuC [Campylobacterota bacterium]|nr:DNA recombination protein RmuC [Campylobacterota bacterium]
MEFILNYITDESQRLFLLGVLTVIILTIALVIVIFISRIMFLKHQLFDGKVIDVEKDREISRLQEQYRITEIKNGELEEELQVLNNTKDALKSKKQLILKMQEKIIYLEESLREHLVAAEAESRDLQTLTFKYKSLQKRNEFLIDENRQFRSINMKYTLKVRDQDRRIFEKLMAAQGNKEEHRREIEILASRSLDKNQQLFDLLNSDPVSESILSLSDDIVQYKSELIYGYEKRFSKDKNLQSDIFLQSRLYQQIEDDTYRLLDISKDEKKLETLGEQIVEHILDLSQIDREKIIREDEESTGILLPNHQKIVIDATFSIGSYEVYRDTIVKSKRELALRDYIESFKKHIDLMKRSLSQGEYRVILIPTQEALRVVLKNEERLYDQLSKRGLLLVSPTTLLVTLQNIAILWEYHRHYKHSSDIGIVVEELYAKFLKFGKEISVVSQNLEMIQGSLPVNTDKNRSI